MSSPNVNIKKQSISKLKQVKGKTPLVCLTAYDALMANIIDNFCDIILVGDSVGNVRHGYSSTVAVDMGMMLFHAKSVARVVEQALLVIDMPFGSYENDKLTAYENALQLLKIENVDAIKVETLPHIIPIIEHLTKRAIPVMGHIGLLPQSISLSGKYSVKGKTQNEMEFLIDLAKQCEKAGCFAIVLEAVKEEVAIKITQEISIPTIGIGASSRCDGQILVTEDLLGFNEKNPKFAKKYCDARQIFNKALKEYAKDVKIRKFPLAKNIYN